MDPTRARVRVLFTAYVTIKGMAARDMTFSIPEEVASLLTQQIEATGHSQFVTEAVEERLRRKQRLEAACDVVGDDPALERLERDWDALSADGLENDAW